MNQVDILLKCFSKTVLKVAVHQYVFVYIKLH